MTKGYRVRAPLPASRKEVIVIGRGVNGVALGQCWNSECTDHAAKIIGTALGWTQEEVSTAEEAFEIEYSRFMHKPVAAATSTR